MPTDYQQIDQESAPGRKGTTKLPQELRGIDDLKELDVTIARGNEDILLDEFGSENDFKKIAPPFDNTTNIIEKDLVIFTTGYLVGNELLTNPIFIAHYPMELVGISEIHQNGSASTLQIIVDGSNLLTTAMSLNTTANVAQIFEKPDFVKDKNIIGRGKFIKTDFVTGSGTGYTGMIMLYFKYRGKGDYKIK